MFPTVFSIVVIDPLGIVLRALYYCTWYCTVPVLNSSSVPDGQQSIKLLAVGQEPLYLSLANYCC